MSEGSRTYCRPHKKGIKLQGKTSKKYCSQCGYRKRGKHHEEGMHHKSKTEKRKIK